MTDPLPLVAQLGDAAETTSDPHAAAYLVHAARQAAEIDAEMEQVQARILALIPKRERGAPTAVIVAEAMVRLNTAVNQAITEARRASDGMAVERGR